MRIAAFLLSFQLPLALVALPLVVLPLVVLPEAVDAHDIRLPLAADELTVISRPPGPPVYKFDFTGQQAILLGPDPRGERTAVLVYGTGVNGGSTGRLDLDPSLWTPTPGGYAYSDPSGATGILSIVLEQGRLEVIGADAGWTWAPAGRVDELWFHFLIEDEWFCAEADLASADEDLNQIGRIRFFDTTAPFSCPEQVCGNGLREPGEV